ncbi:hypothetical protein SAMD00079811_82810 (plasmid) [Scytonema sp. HK-05]|nr:hypothetical protein SAMD00079811_82810 [Scytonema sp. HK-05]
MVREISSEIDNVRQLLSGLSVEEKEAIRSRATALALRVPEAIASSRV